MKIKCLFFCICILNILAVSAFAETNTEHSQISRKLSIPFANPLKNLEANAQMYLTLTELSGFTTDYLNKKFHLDDSAFGRLTQTFFCLYSVGFWGYYSHETAHGEETLKFGAYSARVDFRDWSILVPRYKSEISYYPTSKQLIKIVTAGLNQEEYEAFLVNQMTIKQVSFDRGLSFLFRKFSTATYDIYSSTKIDVVKEGDVGIYSAELKNSGIKLSARDISLQSALSAVFSFKTYDSLHAVYNYLWHGKRSTDSTIIRFKGYEFTPPLIQYVMTERGGFFNLTSALLNKKSSMDISLGTDLGSWTGDVDNIRFGFKMNELISLGPVEISPFGYINLKRTKVEHNGSLVGTELFWKINKNFGLNVRIAYSDNDIMEEARGNENGLIINSALSFSF